MVAIPGPQNNVDLMRVSGAFLTGFSLVMTPLVLFVLPGSCSLVAAFEVLALFVLFVTGMVILIIGQTLNWRKKRTGNSN